MAARNAGGAAVGLLLGALLGGGLRQRRRCRRLFAIRHRAVAANENEESGGSSGAFLNETSAAILLFVLAFLYGGNVPLLKAIETETPLAITGPEVLTLRFFAACLLVIPWMLFNWQKIVAVFMPGVELGCWLWLGYTLQVLGLEKTSASAAAITSALIGITVQFLEVVVEGKPLRPAVAASSAGVIVGLSLFATAPGGAENPLKPLVDRVWNFYTSISQWPRPMPHDEYIGGVSGDVLAVSGAVLFGVHVWRCNRIIQAAESTPTAAGKDFELALSILQCFVTTVLCAIFSFWDSPYSLSEQEFFIKRLPLEVWLQIAACGVVFTGLPSVLELFAFKVVPPAVASLIYCTIPLWGTVLGVIFLKDSFGPQSILGGLIILTSSLAPSVIDLLSPGKVVEEEQSGELSQLRGQISAEVAGCEDPELLNECLASVKDVLSQDPKTTRE